MSNPAAAAFWLGLALPARPTDRDLGQPARRVAGGTGCAGRSVDLCGGCRSKTAKGGSARQLPFASRTPGPLPRGRVSDFLREACPSEVLNWVRSCCHWQPEAASAPGGGNPKGSWDSGDSVDSASHAVAFGHAAADAVIHRSPSPSSSGPAGPDGSAQGGGGSSRHGRQPPPPMPCSATTGVIPAPPGGTMLPN